MRNLAIVAMLCVGCGDDSGAPSDAGADAMADAMYCDTDAGTPYNGPSYYCAERKGLCVVGQFGYGTGENCYPRCVGTNTLCPPGYIGWLLHVGGEATECYCMPR